MTEFVRHYTDREELYGLCGAPFDRLFHVYARGLPPNQRPMICKACKELYALHRLANLNI